MPYNPYPQRPNIPHGATILGETLSKFGQNIEDFQERQRKMRELMAEMTMKRAEALYAQQAAEDKHREAERADAKDKERLKYLAAIKKGKTISPTLEKDPSLSRSTAEYSQYGDKAADIAELEDVEGYNLPTQGVAGGSSLAEAASGLIGEGANGRLPLSREETLDLAHEMGQMTPEQYATATKPPTMTNRANPQLLRTIRDQLLERKAKGLPTTREDVRDLILANDPDGTLMASKEGHALLQATTPEAAIQAAELAAKKYATGRQEFGIKTNIQLKEQLDNDPYIKPFAQADRKYKQTLGVYQKYKETGNPAFVDRTLTVNFNKLIDETSAVMGGEVDATVAEMGMGDRLLGKIQKFLAGGAGYTDQERDQIIAVMGALHEQLQEKAKNAYFTARGQALDFGADPDAVTALYRPLFEGGEGKYTPEYSGAGKSRGKEVPARGNRKPVDAATAARYLKQAGGDRRKAKQMLAKDGYNIK